MVEAVAREEEGGGLFAQHKALEARGICQEIGQRQEWAKETALRTMGDTGRGGEQHDGKGSDTVKAPQQVVGKGGSTRRRRREEETAAQTTRRLLEGEDDATEQPRVLEQATEWPGH